MTRTEIITNELLETVDQPETIEAVYSRHADSRGPFYRALAEATGVLRARYNGLIAKVRQEKGREEALRSSVGQLENRLGKMQEFEDKLAKNIEKHQAVLNRLAELSTAGFGEAQFAKLVEVLVGWTAKSGLKPAEAINRFLETAGRLTDILSLEEERVRAEKERATAEAAAKKAIAQSKLTTEAVEAAKWLMSQRISTKTMLAWRAIGVQLSLPVEGFSQAMVDALKQYGTLEATCRTKSKDQDELTKQVEKLKAETATLQTERQRIRAALDSVAKDGQGRVQAMEKTAAGAVNSVKDQAVTAIRNTWTQFEEAISKANVDMGGTIQKFERLTKEAAELERDVAFAKALRSNNPALWLDVAPESWDAIFERFLEWVKIRRINTEVPIPDEVKKACKGSVEYTSLYGQFRLPLPAIVEWLRAGLKELPAASPALPWSSVLARLSGRSSLGQ